MIRIVIIALLSPAAVQAACPGTVVLSCTVATGSKALEVCLSGPEISYSFGPPGGTVEVLLSARLGPGIYVPHAGRGRDRYQSVRISDATQTYESWVNYDSLDPTSTVAAGVYVLEGEEVVETALCDPESIIFDFSDLGPATEAAGYCWDDKSYDWTKLCT